MIRVLFICVHNSARSQMAEAYLNRLGEGRFVAESAGLEPAPLNPFTVRAMAEDGVDISDKIPRDVFELFRSGRLFSVVVTVCARAEERCPVFPGVTRRLAWPFPDPAGLTGTDDEILAGVRVIRDDIKEKIRRFVETVAADDPGPL